MKQVTTLLTNTINRSKKLALMIAFLLTAAVSYSFAAAPTGEVKISSDIRAAFHKDFQNAEVISAETHKSFTKLTFKMNNIVLFAFYSDNGELLAVTRNILSTQLPVGLQISLRKEFSSYWITELIELNGDGQNSYYVSLENADKKLTLRSNGDESWEVYEKTDKK
jgi:hypothetical protein